MSFSRELLLLLLLGHLSLSLCADSSFYTKFENRVAMDVSFPVDGKQCHEDEVIKVSSTDTGASSVVETNSVLNLSGGTITTNESLMTSDPLSAFSARLSHCSSNDLGGSSLFSDVRRKSSIDSSFSEIERSNFFTNLENGANGYLKEEDDFIFETVDSAVVPSVLKVSKDAEADEEINYESNLLTPTVISEVGSENDSDFEEAYDCFDGWSVYRVSMDWISLNFVPYLKSGKRLSSRTSFEILEIAQSIFEHESTIPSLTMDEGENLTVVGDIHGQFEDLIRIFEQNGYPSHNNKYIFNGDIVDRGSGSVECLLTLFLMKICSSESIFITRGNHESHTCGDGTFKQECFEKSATPLKFFNDCHSVFDVLPLAYVIQEKYFVCHGGLPEHFDISLMKNAKKKELTPLQEFLKMSLMWNDPHDGPGMIGSKRGGLTHSFGSDVTFQFLRRHGFSMLIRSHEYHRDGFFYSQNKQCLTIFSAPNYCGVGNRGVIMRINHDTTYNIIQIIVPVLEENLSYSLHSTRIKERSLTMNLEDEDYELPFASGIGRASETEEGHQNSDLRLPKIDEETEVSANPSSLSDY